MECTKINIVELLKDKNLTENMILEIECDNPISLGEKINSSFIKSVNHLSDNKIYGLVENIIEFHYPTNMRKKIKKLIKSKTINQTPDQVPNIAYIPIIDEIIKFEEINILDIKERFIDDFSNLLSANDLRHIEGCKIVGSCVQPIKKKIIDSVKAESKNKDKSKIINKHIDKFPTYYSSLNKREYIILNNKIIIEFKTNKLLKNILLEKNKINKIGYLGNSESIVNVEIYEK